MNSNNHIFNSSDQKVLRRSLRNNSPYPEIVLWQRLRKSQLFGFKFRRQAGIGQYVVDFYCPKLKLAIEIDGDSHLNKRSILKDTERQQRIESRGINIIRFTNKEIIENIDGVLTTLVSLLEKEGSLRK